MYRKIDKLVVLTLSKLAHFRKTKIICFLSFGFIDLKEVHKTVCTCDMRIKMKLPMGTKGLTGWGNRGTALWGECGQQELYNSGFNSTLYRGQNFWNLSEKKKPSKGSWISFRDYHSHVLNCTTVVYLLSGGTRNWERGMMGEFEGN